MKDYRTIRVTVEDKEASIVLSRPERRNAFDAVMIQELADAFAALKSLDTRIVMLSGEGAIFCAGADATWMQTSANLTYEQNREDALAFAHLYHTMQTFPVPIVTLVQGGAFGGALGFLAASDIVIAEKEARFSFGEARMGLIPAVVSAYVVPKIGVSQARYLFLTATQFGSEYARAIGLVHRICAASHLQEEAKKIRDEVLLCAPGAIRQTKRLLLENYLAIDSKTIESCATAIAGARITEEAQEGLKAFLDKRPPSWTKK